MNKKYGCIISDPPWYEQGGGKCKRGADRHYPLMKTKEIVAMGPWVQSIAADDAHLLLWVTNNYLEDAFEVINAWGFRYITKIEWLKEGRAGLGQWFRGRSEPCLFCKRGNPKYRTLPNGKRAQGETVIATPDNMDIIEVDGAWFEHPRVKHEGQDKHSGKPSRIHEWAEVICHGPYAELFQVGTPREGWDVFGNHVWEKDYVGMVETA